MVRCYLSLLKLFYTIFFVNSTDLLFVLWLIRLKDRSREVQSAILTNTKTQIYETVPQFCTWCCRGCLHHASKTSSFKERKKQTPKPSDTSLVKTRNQKFCPSPVANNGENSIWYNYITLLIILIMIRYNYFIISKVRSSNSVFGFNSKFNSISVLIRFFFFTVAFTFTMVRFTCYWSDL